MKIIFLALILFTPYLTWSDDIWFTLPSKNQPVSGNMEIKIFPPYQEVSVNVWIESKVTDEVVWIAQLLPENNYSIIVDTTRFKPGKYEINAQYYLQGEEYDGDVNIWVNAP